MSVDVSLTSFPSTEGLGRHVTRHQLGVFIGQLSGNLRPALEGTADDFRRNQSALALGEMSKDILAAKPVSVGFSAFEPQSVANRLTLLMVQAQGKGSDLFPKTGAWKSREGNAAGHALAKAVGEPQWDAVIIKSYLTTKFVEHNTAAAASVDVRRPLASPAMQIADGYETLARHVTWQAMRPKDLDTIVAALARADSIPVSPALQFKEVATAIRTVAEGNPEVWKLNRQLLTAIEKTAVVVAGKMAPAETAARAALEAPAIQPVADPGQLLVHLAAASGRRPVSHQGRRPGS